MNAIYLPNVSRHITTALNHLTFLISCLQSLDNENTQKKTTDTGNIFDLNLCFQYARQRDKAIVFCAVATADAHHKTECQMFCNSFIDVFWLWYPIKMKH